MSSARKQLKNFSWVYIVIAAICVIGTILCFCFADKAAEIVEKSYKDIDLKDIKPEVFLAINVGFRAVFYLIYFWLLRRIVNGKSRGTFIMVLLIIGVIGNVFSLISGNFSVILSTLIDVYILQLIFRIRSEED